MKICSRVLDVKKNNDFYSIITDGYEIRLCFVTDSIIRIRAGFDGQFREESYSLVTTAWEDRLDGVMSAERNRIKVAESSIAVYDKDKQLSSMDYQISSQKAWIIKSNKLTVTIEKDPFRLSVIDSKGQLLHRDLVDLGYRYDPNNRACHSFEIVEGDGFYGFGEQTGSFNKFQENVILSPSDAMGYDPKKRSGLYKHIPFFIKLNENTKSAVGYFYHNTYDAQFDMGKSHSNYWSRHANIIADGGDVDLFLITGQSPKDIVSGYTLLTGRPALLPKKALGYLGSSMYYSELDKDCDKALVKFVETAKKEGFPIDGFQLSSGYTSQSTKEGDKRCVFTWNKNRFPNPSDYFSKMKDMGIVVSPNVKPGVLLAHPDLDKFLEKDMLVKASKDAMDSRRLHSTTESNSVVDDVEIGDAAFGTWWGGKGVFVDFTNPSARESWKLMLKDNLLKYGTASVWNDNCEYESIIDKDSIVDFDGRSEKISALRNAQSNLMCKVTAEAIKEEFSNTRPFIVCRAGHAGIQRYAQNWSGDNLTCWDTLKYNVATMLGMSLCGVSNYGCDIGGFYGEAPEPELLVRWVQNGIFQPRFSIHSVNTDNTVTEPWMYPEYTEYIRDAVKLRYALSAYYYSLMKEANEEGIAIMRPFLLEFPNDALSFDEAEEFMIGPSLMVSNVLEPGQFIHEVRFPNDTQESAGFYDLSTREFFEGGQCCDMEVSIEDIPMYIRSGGIIPFVENELSNLDDDITDIRYICAGDLDGEFTLYEDDGKSYDYKEGHYLKTHIDMASSQSKCQIKFEYEGDYKSTIKQVKLDVISQGTCPCYVTLYSNEYDKINILRECNKSDQYVETKMQQYLYKPDFDKASQGWYYDIARNSTYIKYPYISDGHSILVSYDSLDMLGM